VLPALELACRGNVMAHWLLKTEASAFSWDDQLQRGHQGEPWTGVRNHTAKRNLSAMKLGDLAFFYHSGDEKRIVGIVEVIKEAYPDPTDSTGKFVVVDVKAVEPLPRPVRLADIRADARLADMVLVHQSRLSVQPVSLTEWRTICRMGGLTAS
jgi:predicted RNA-binding protein with PUA-like domain